MQDLLMSYICRRQGLEAMINRRRCLLPELRILHPSQQPRHSCRSPLVPQGPARRYVT
jgi:hypothetical protein